MGFQISLSFFLKKIKIIFDISQINNSIYA